MSTTDTTPGALVASLFERLDEHDPAALRGPWRADTHERLPDGLRRGPEEIGAWFDGLLAAAPDLRVEVVSFLESGEEVFVRWRATGHPLMDAELDATLHACRSVVVGLRCLHFMDPAGVHLAA